MLRSFRVANHRSIRDEQELLSRFSEPPVTVAERMLDATRHRELSRQGLRAG